MHGLDRLSNLGDYQGGLVVRFGYFLLASSLLPETFRGTALGFSHET